MKYGLAGYPIGHSLSPALFRSAYPDLEYDLIETTDFQEVAVLLRNSYDAINVTAPFKEQAFAAADRADSVTALIGAANILRKEVDGSISAFNTDYDAVKAILDSHLGSAAQHAVLVVGCGGAGKAAAAAASRLGHKVLIANRTEAKAEAFCKTLNNAEALEIYRIAEILPSVDAVVYTLPLSIPEAELISSRDILKIEANYRNPSICGSNYVSGRQWLLVQAIAGYGLMTGRKPDESRLASTINNQ